MREIYEFRVSERFASLLFSDNEGKKAGPLIRVIKLEKSDPRYIQVGQLQKELRQKYGKPFFYGWSIERTATSEEKKAAELYQIMVNRIFEPAGEECGTTYNDSDACPICGSGAKQMGPLYMKSSAIPKLDISETIAGEMIISKRFAVFLKDHSVTGCEVGPIRSSGRNLSKGAELENHFQFRVINRDAKIVPPSIIGSGPFDHDEKREYFCKNGDLLGLNILSPISIARREIKTTEIFSSTQTYGMPRAVLHAQTYGGGVGLLRPRRVLFISPYLVQLIEKEKFKGFKFEIAYMV